MEPHHWTTEKAHFDNNETMDEFIDSFLDELGLELVERDGTYAEVKDGATIYAAHAAGNGDSFNHVVSFELIGANKMTTEFWPSDPVLDAVADRVTENVWGDYHRCRHEPSCLKGLF